MQSHAGLTFRRCEVAKAVCGRSAELVIAGAIAFASACQDVAVTPVAVVNVEIRPETVMVILGETQQLSVIVTDGAGRELRDRPTVWSSENTDIAEVDANGIVSSTGVGTTRIVAAAEGQTGQGSVTVMPKPVASVTIEPDELALRAADEDTIRALVHTADSTELTDRDVDWSTGDESIVQVSGHGPGNRQASVRAGDCPSGQVRCAAQIVAAAEDVADTITVTVMKVPAGITIAAPGNPPYRLLRRRTLQLAAQVEASDGTDLTEEVSITWSSSDDEVATVDQTGKVTGVRCPRVRLFCPATISAAVPGAAEVNAAVEIEVFKFGTAVSALPVVKTLAGGVGVTG